MRKIFVGASLISTALCMACHTYSAVAVNSIDRGNDVQLTFSPQGTTEIASLVGPNVVGLDGTILSRDSAGLQMSVQETRRSDGTSDFLHGQTVRIPADAISSAQIKKIAAVQSVILAGAIVTGAALVARGGGGSSSGVPAGTNPAGTK